jgi:hypothetical protein
MKTHSDREKNKMRTILIFLVASLFILSSAFAVGGKPRKYSSYDTSGFYYSDISIYMNDGSIIIIHQGLDDIELEITEDFELFINDRRIKTDDDQKEILRRFYFQMEAVVKYSKEIGLAGAEIGAKGARIGLKAAAGGLRLIVDGREIEILESDLEPETEQLEAEAERLEEKAEILEEMAQELESTFDDMVDEIPELRELDWF